jgi:hypothetical protein
MRRLLEAPDGGLPYLNSDLTDILQAQHLKSYRAMLDSINYGSTSSTYNSGIILSGCDIISTGVSNFVMSFSSSVVYIDGEFYQNDPSYQTNNQTISSGTFYLIPGPTASETRVLRDLTTTATVSNTRYFTYSTAPPSVPHIEFSSQGTSRYLKRIIKYFTSRTGDIYVTKSKINFDGNGVGFNDMEGFITLESITAGAPSIPGSPDLSGKFLVYDSTYQIKINGGSHSSIISKLQLPSHGHKTFPSITNFGFIHDHHYNVGTQQYINGEFSDAGNPDLEPTDIAMGSIFGKGVGSPTNVYTGGVNNYATSDLATHIHGISTEFGDLVLGNTGSEHENRPPYYVVVYYTKKQN